MSPLHKVHMADGTIQMLSAEALDALDPITWTAQESPRPRFEVRANIISPTLTLYSVWDRDSETQVEHPGWSFTTENEDEAKAHAEELNSHD